MTTDIIRAEGRPDWAADAVLYQIFPDRFRNGDPGNDPPGTVAWGTEPDREHFQGGDLLGVVERVDHLQRLGVTGLYLNPIFVAGTNHRYDTWDYLQVDPHLGDTGLLRELVAEAHGKGIRVLLDGVFNHCGDGHSAFRDWRANGATSPYAGWFTGWSAQPDGTLDYQTCGGADYLPKLNLTDAGARAHVLEVARHWIAETGIDGWRLDVPFKVAHDMWEEFRSAVRDVAPDAYLLGEVWRDGRPWLDVFDGTTNYRQRANVLDFCLFDHLDAEDFAQECRELAEHHGGAAPWMVNLVGSHDTTRVLTLAGGDVDRTACAFVATFCLPGIPLVYYGDEIGLTGGDDPGCRAAMPWDEDHWNQRLLGLVTTLSTLRHQQPALRRGSFVTLLCRNGLAAFARRLDDDEVIVIVNPRAAQRDVSVDVASVHDGMVWTDGLSGRRFPERNGRITVDLVSSASALVLYKGPQGEADHR